MQRFNARHAVPIIPVLLVATKLAVIVIKPVDSVHSALVVVQAFALFSGIVVASASRERVPTAIFVASFLSCAYLSSLIRQLFYTDRPVLLAPKALEIVAFAAYFAYMHRGGDPEAEPSFGAPAKARNGRHAAAEITSAAVAFTAFVVGFGLYIDIAAMACAGAVILICFFESQFENTPLISWFSFAAYAVANVASLNAVHLLGHAAFTLFICLRHAPV